MDEQFDVEICRDLKRLAGIANKFGTTSPDGRKAVGGMISLSGPVLLYIDYYGEYKPLGFYSIEEIEEAVKIMYN